MISKSVADLRIILLNTVCAIFLFFAFFSSFAFAHSSNFKSYEECVISSLSGTNNTKAVEFIEKACAAKFADELDALREQHQQEIEEVLKRLTDGKQKFREEVARLKAKHRKEVSQEQEKIAKLNNLIDALKEELAEAENWLDKLPTPTPSDKRYNPDTDVDSNIGSIQDIPNLVLSSGQLQRVKAGLSECWVVPNITFDDKLSVDLRVFVGPSGEVIRAQVIDHEEYDANAEVRLIANAALRAVKGCSPLPLDDDVDAPVRQFIVNFKP